MRRFLKGLPLAFIFTSSGAFAQEIDVVDILSGGGDERTGGPAAERWHLTHDSGPGHPAAER